MQQAKHVISVSHNFSFIVQLHYEILIKSASMLIYNDVISLSLKMLGHFYFCTPRAGEVVEMNPAIPDIVADTVRIGGSLNGSYPYNEDVVDLIGDVDNIRIFNFTLIQADIFSLPDIPTAPADLNGDSIVNQADKDIVQANMGPEKLWP